MGYQQWTGFRTTVDLIVSISGTDQGSELVPIVNQVTKFKISATQ